MAFKDLALWLSALAFVTAAVAVSLGGLFAVNRFLRARISFDELLSDNGVVGWFFSGVLVFYGVTLGLVAIATWEGTTAASELVSKEAASIGALYRDTRGYPEPLRSEGVALLRSYTRFIIEEAWPAQRRGVVIDDNRTLDEFQRRLFSHEPQTEGQKIVHAETIRAFNHMIEQRRERIESVDSGLPDILWIVVTLGAVVSVVLSYCFNLPKLLLHALLVGSLAAIVGLVIFMIFWLDRPYVGHASVSPEPYEMLLKRMESGD